MLVSSVSAVAGSALIGSYAIGAPAMDLATSVSGAAGAGLGYAAGSFLAGSLSNSTLVMLAPVAGAIAVPAVASGTLDQAVVILGVGAVVGAYVGKMVYDKYMGGAAPAPTA